jgi:hypothetical protein
MAAIARELPPEVAVPSPEKSPLRLEMLGFFRAPLTNSSRRPVGVWRIDAFHFWGRFSSQF